MSIRHRRLLRPRRERPRRRAAEQRDELATPDHSITSSARASREGGTVRPSALAVLRLSTVWYLVGACTGRSAGLAPFRRGRHSRCATELVDVVGPIGNQAAGGDDGVFEVD